MKQLNNREKQSIAKKLHITQIAMSLFKERGYNDVKVTEICQTAKISLGTFYHYFSSKDSIIDETYKSIDERVFERINDIKFKNPIEKLIGILKQSACTMEEELGYLFLAGSYHQIISSKPEYSYSHERKLFITIMETVTEGITNGYFYSDTDPQEIAEMCLRIGRGDIIDWCLRGGSYKLCELVVKDLKRMLHSTLIESYSL